MQNNSFIMITPVKNEERYLKRVIESIQDSSIKPSVWLILDDDSIDGTPEIIKTAALKNSFILYQKSNMGQERDLKFKYSSLCILGFNKCIEFAKNHNIKWNYIILLDGDTKVPHEYFENIIDAMSVDPSIGIASGEIFSKKGDKFIKPVVFSDVPSGTARVWSRECFFETEGYNLTQAPDSVSTVKARIKGWKTVRFNHIFAYQLRETSAAQGLWNGYYIRGKSTFYLGYNLPLIIGRGIEYLFQKRCYLVIPYLLGIFDSFINKENKIGDKEIINYFSKTRLLEIIRR
jgi:glycosyltransferase involved in cell wall biosynthesis